AAADGRKPQGIRKYSASYTECPTRPAVPCALMDQGEISVAVLGAGGTIAPAIVADLAQSDEVQSMNLLDLDQSRAQAVADAHGGGKASAMEVDARTIDDLASAIGEAGVLVNTASYRVNLEAMQACLQAGCNY